MSGLTANHQLGDLLMQLFKGVRKAEQLRTELAELVPAGLDFSELDPTIMDLVRIKLEHIENLHTSLSGAWERLLVEILLGDRRVYDRALEAYSYLKEKRTQGERVGTTEYQA